MQKSKKVIVAVAAGMIFMSGAWSTKAYSQPHVEGCSATTKIVSCNLSSTQSQGGHSHVLYETPNGKVICAITRIVRTHNEFCAGCRATLATNVAKICEYRHEYCPDQTGLCK